MAKRKWISIILIVFGCAASLARAQTNGDFEGANPENNWSPEGIVSFPDSSGNNFALLREGNSGGRSRIRQQFNLPATPTLLSFRYAFIHSDKLATTSIPPDSFTVYLTHPTSGARLVLSSTDAPDFSKGFLYVDSDFTESSNPPAIFSSKVNVSSIPDADGLRTASLNISTLAGSSSVRVEFGLAGADNGIQSHVIIDDITTTFVCDDDEYDPVISCPADLFTYNTGTDPPPAGAGTATATDNCGIDGITHDDDVNCGCPTVIFREWTATDTADPANTSSCTQKITDLDTEDNPFYDCLENFLGECFLPAKVCDCEPEPAGCSGGLTLQTRINGGCTIAEVLTQCFKERLRNGGDVQSCCVHLAQRLRDANLICQNAVGEVSKCVSKRHDALLKYIQDNNYQACEDGPPGTEPCRSGHNEDCETGGTCCGGSYCVYGSQTCPLPPPSCLP